jgi:putative flippase GtrA
MTHVMGEDDGLRGLCTEMMTRLTLGFWSESIEWGMLSEARTNTDGLDENPKTLIRVSISARVSPWWVEGQRRFLMTAASDVFANKEIKRFSRFLTAGTVGTLLDFGLLTLLKLAGLPTLLANTLSFSAGLINNFTWNRLWTFATQSAQTGASGWRGLLQSAQLGWRRITSSCFRRNICQARSSVSLNGDTFPQKSLQQVWRYFANRQWTFRN